MTIRIYDIERAAYALAFENLVDKIQFRSGAQPAVGAALTGTVLAEIDPPTDWLTAANTSGVASLIAAVSDTSADASGTVGYVAFVNSAGNPVRTESVSLAGGGGKWVLSTLTITAGLSIDIAAGGYTLTLANTVA